MRKGNLNKYAVVSALMVGGALLTACDHESVYDPAFSQKQYQTEWEQAFGTMDANHTSSMATTIPVTYAFRGDALEEYRLQIFTANPLTDSKALLVADVKAVTDEEGKAKTSFNMDIVKGSTSFYACYVDKYNHRYVKYVEVEKGALDVNFDKPVVTRASSDANNVVIPHADEYSAIVTNVESRYEQAKELNAQNSTVNWDGSADYATVLKISQGVTWNGNIPVLPSEGAQSRILYVDGTWNITGVAEQRLGSGMIVVRPGGKIVIPAGVLLNSANAGRIVVLNGGEISGEGQITFSNGSNGRYDYVASGAVFNVGKLNNNGGTVYNYSKDFKAEVIMGGSTNSVYVNHGKMEVGHSETDANLFIKNACQLYVREDINVQNLWMGRSSYAEVRGRFQLSVNGWGGEVLMADGSFLDAKGSATFNGGHIVGTTDGASIVQFGSIYNGSTLFYTTSSVDNNVYVSVARPDAESEWLVKAFNRAGNGKAVLVDEGKANVTIAKGECTPGYNALSEPPHPVVTQSFIFACEDLGSTFDYDFNDVVFSVAHAAGSDEMTVTALAAGGTKGAEIVYDETTIGEVHALLGGVNNFEMINTSGLIERQAEPTVIKVDRDWSLIDNYNKFKLRVMDGEQSVFIEAPAVGKAPMMLIVPADWRWPLETVDIRRAYPDFTEWVKDATITDWLNAMKEDKVVKR